MNLLRLFRGDEGFGGHARHLCMDALNRSRMGSPHASKAPGRRSLRRFMGGAPLLASLAWGVAGCASTVVWKFDARSESAEHRRTLSASARDRPDGAGKGRAPRTRTASAASTPARQPSARRSRGKGAAACYQGLRDANVAFDEVTPARAGGIDYPIKLTGELGGIRIRGNGKQAPTAYLDCRLAEALLAWTPTLRAAGITAIDHYSMYRKNAKVAGTSKPSGHASGFAIDAARFHFADGTEVGVLDDWEDRTRGADPCSARPHESSHARRVRDVVCEAAEKGIFQIVITPHYNEAHHNHVHLEIAEQPRAAWIR